MANSRKLVACMAELTGPQPIGTVFNTHSNGDHWYGNQLLSSAEIITTQACSEEMHAEGGTTPASVMDLPGRAGEFAREIFGPFDWSDLHPTYPTKTFEGDLSLDVGGVEVQLIQLGPAHTRGDGVAYVPSARTLYTGDLLFIGGTPIIWAGPLENWVAACDAMAALDVEYVVPGHGPVTDKAGIAAVKHYLEYVDEQARAMYAQGVPPDEAARRINLSEFASWNEGGRIIQNVLAVYYELDPTLSHWGRQEIFEQIAELEGRAAAEPTR